MSTATTATTVIEKNPLWKKSISGVEEIQFNNGRLVIETKKSIELWNIISGEKIEEIQYPPNGDGYTTFLGYNSKIALIDTELSGTRIEMWDYIQNVRLWYKVSQLDIVTCCGFTLGEQLFIVMNRNTMFFFDVNNHGEIVRQIDLPAHSHLHFAFSPNGQIMATSTNDEVILWDTNTWEIARRLSKRHNLGPLMAKTPLGRIIFSQDGKWIANSNRENGCWIWNINTEEEVLDLEGIATTGLEFNGIYQSEPFGNSSKIRDLVTGQDKYLLINHGYQPQYTYFITSEDRDRKWVVIYCRDGTLSVYRLSNLAVKSAIKK